MTINEQDILTAFKSIDDLFDYRIRQIRGDVGPENLRRFWEVDVGGRDHFSEYGFAGDAAYVLYFLNHPVKAFVGSSIDTMYWLNGS